MSSGFDPPGGEQASPSASESLEGTRPRLGKNASFALSGPGIFPGGFARRRQVRLSAKVADAVARVIITLGGLGVIATVLGVFVYLLWVVIPLFLPGSVEVVACHPWPPGTELWDHGQPLGNDGSGQWASGGQATGRGDAEVGRGKFEGFPKQEGNWSAGNWVNTRGSSGSENGFPDAKSQCVHLIREASPYESQEGMVPWEITPGPTYSRGHETDAKGDDELQATGPGVLSTPANAGPVRLILDETATVVAVVGKGWVRQFSVKGGSFLGASELLPTGIEINGWQFDPSSGRWFAGTETGELFVGKWVFDVSYPTEESLPETLRNLPVGASQPCDGGVLSRPAQDQFRLVKGRAESQDPVKLADAPILLVDGLSRGNTDVVVVMTQDGYLHTYALVHQKNLLTGKVRTRVSGGRLEVRNLAEKGWPRWLLVGGKGDMAVALWERGWYQRYDLGDPIQPKLAEEGQLASRSLGEATEAACLLGRNTFVLAHREGRVSAWFLASVPDRGTADGRALVCGHVLGSGRVEPTVLAAGQRGRLVAVGYEDGSIRIYHVTSEREVAVWKRTSRSPLISVAFSPKDDVLVAATPNGLEVAALRVPHPEVSWKAIWGRVWYENYPRPAFVWQSSGATDDFEPKYGLVPLVFGTAKATFYSLLFALPLGLLGAIYASEFLHPRVRNRIKTTVEMMASLPSVVLGFVAAFVVAPLVERRVPEVLCLFGTLPLALLACGYLWEMLPYRWRSSGALRAVGILGAGGLGVVLAWQVGPVAERLLFQGDLKGWLSGTRGHPWGGWVFLWMPLASVLTVWINARWLGPLLYRSVFTRSPIVAGSVRLAKLAICVVIALSIAFVAGWISSMVFGDPRGNLLGTYVQRNALVVGMIMGFAIVPLIFTLAEDALSAVPQDLRAASLGAGATPWQTAFRVVIPAAMSGLFSAAMIGLARAAGETMIVLMAAGNTPIMEWNPFNGFRTLSANIAVELPEAVQNSTHYRMLFLAALCLFVLTSVVNTAAELVRLRFRKQAARL